ncbi:MAG: DNA repair protein RecO [Candidatus Gracilibacteria bacterium]|jgi:DNA repair protein RecO
MLQNFRAIVLSRKQFGENDLLTCLITDEGQLLKVILKGGGRPASRRRAHVEPANLINGTVYFARLPRLGGGAKNYAREIKSEKSFTGLKSNFEKIEKTQCLLKVVENCLYENHAEKGIFDLLLETLTELNSPAAAPLTSEIATIKLLNTLGLLPNFKECSACHNHAKESALWMSTDKTLYCESCRAAHGEDPATNQSAELETKYRKALEFFRANPIAECRNLRTNPEEETKLKSLILSLSAGLLPHGAYKTHAVKSAKLTAT